jgi:hypothetical protein
VPLRIPTACHLLLLGAHLHYTLHYTLHNNLHGHKQTLTTFLLRVAAGHNNNVTTITKQAPFRLRRERERRRLPKDEQKRLEEQLARAIVMQDLPFDSFSQPESVALLEMLQPKFKVPSADKVANQLVPQLFKSVMDEVSATLTRGKPDAVGILSDGWTDGEKPGGRSVVHNAMIGAPVSFLAGTYRCENNRQEHGLLEQIKRLVNVADQYFINNDLPVPKLIGVVTDSPSVNKGARVLADNDQALEERQVVMYGCVCHSLNLHGLEICTLRNVPAVMEAATRVVKYFRNVTPAKEALQAAHVQLNEKPHTLHAPGSETRLVCRLRMVESLLRSRDALVRVARSHVARRMSHELPESFTTVPVQVSAESESRQKKNKKKVPTTSTSSKRTSVIIGEEEADHESNTVAHGSKAARSSSSGATSSSSELARQSVQQLICADYFWQAIETVRELLRPVCYYVHLLQQEDTVPAVSMVTATFVALHRFYANFTERHPQCLGGVSLASLLLTSVRMVC